MEGLGHWWTEEVLRDAQIGGKIEFSFCTKSGELLGEMGMKVQELNKNKDVSWRCVEEPAEAEPLIFITTGNEPLLFL